MFSARRQTALLLKAFLSVSPSVCLSVTLVVYAKRFKIIEMCFTHTMERRL